MTKAAPPRPTLEHRIVCLPSQLEKRLYGERAKGLLCLAGKHEVLAGSQNGIGKLHIALEVGFGLGLIELGKDGSVWKGLY